MKKTIYEHAIGGDGAVAGLYIEDGFLVEKVSYPLSKAAAPAHKFIDTSVDTLEAKIPGDWDKAILEPMRIAGHGMIDKLLGVEAEAKAEVE
jgi:hypothetical protein